jgi:hypothetical protein
MKTKKHNKRHILKPVHHTKAAIRVTPKFIHGMVLGAVFGVLVVGSLRYASTAYGASNNSSYCIVNPITLSNGTGQVKSYTVSGGVATAHFTVSGKNGCTAPVTLASWRAPYGSTNVEPISDQKLFDSKTQTFTAGNYTMDIKIPDCNYQVDLLRLSRATAPDGTPNYASGEVADFIQAVTKPCEPPTTPPPPTTTKKTTPPPSTPAPSTTTPTTLVNTGPGALVIIGFLAIFAGYIYHIRHSHKRVSHHHR